jgi:O-succinylbenzoate synthase
LYRNRNHIVRLDHATLYRYALPLTEPLVLNDVTLREREGLLIRLEDDESLEAWGEVAPLPGFSPEALPEATQAARAACARLEGRALPAAASPDPAFFDELDEHPLPPSVRFGVEQAVLTLAARRAGTSLPRVLSDEPNATVFLNELLRPGDALDALVRRVRRDDYRAAKLKVGRRSVADDVRLVRRAREALPPDVALRLDANRAWTFDEARAFAERIADCDVAYVEEPLRDAASLADFAAQDLLPVALDESVVGMEPDDLTDYARAIVLKPALLGLRRALRLGRRAETLGVTPVVSGAYESGVGAAALVALAAAFRSNAPAGLTTYRRLRNDVLAPPLDLDESRIDVPALFDQKRHVEQSALKPVPES